VRLSSAQHEADREVFDRRLLARHRPYLRYDSQDAFRVASAETIAEGISNVLTRADGSIIARPRRHAGRPLSLELLLRYPDGARPSAGDRFNEGPDVLADGVRLQESRRHANRVYGRVIREGRRIWLQYWLWYYFDQKQLLGFGSHEGDWETVQVGLDSSGNPELVTFSRHQGAIARRWHEIELHRTRSGDHPIVYVAPFSHACYSEPGTHLYLGGIDNPDGRGPATLPDVEPFGEWSHWPGRWGSSKGVLQRWTGFRFLGGRSPASPACQVERWERPTRYFRRGRRSRPIDALGRWLCRLGDTGHRIRAETNARLDRDQVRVGYSAPRSRRKRPRYLYITVHAVGNGDRVLATRSLRAAERDGTVAIPLPCTPGRCLVRVSAFNLFRQRGRVREHRISQSLPSARKRVGNAATCCNPRHVSPCFAGPRRAVLNRSARRRSLAPVLRNNAGRRARDPP
jgi:hypothetical protein